MANGDPGPYGVGAWLARAGPAIELLNKIGFTTFLLLMIGLGLLWASGIIPLKPFEDMSAEHVTLRDEVRGLRADVRDLLGLARERLTIARRSDRRIRIVDCARILDKELRELCLYVDEEKLKEEKP